MPNSKTPDEIFLQRLEELKKWLEAHDGVYPKRSPLGVWINNQRQAHKGNAAWTLSAPRAELLESLPGWQWNPFNDTVDNALARVRAWYARGVGHPSRWSKDPEEKYCADRVMAIRQHLKKEARPEITKPYREIVGWVDSRRDYLVEVGIQPLTRVRAWYARGVGHPCRQSEDPEERYCGDRVKDIRRCIKKGIRPEVTGPYQEIVGWKDAVYSTGPRS